MTEEKVSDDIISKGVDLWCKKLKEPTFDNGDDSERGMHTQALVHTNVSNDIRKAGGMDSIVEKIEIFRQDLTSELIAQRDAGGYFRGYLGCDYHPCKELANSADVAKIPHSMFSCKSSVDINDDHVSVKWGYGTEHDLYYPLCTGQWLITSLRGNNEDMERIKFHAVNGNTMKFRVED